MSVRLNKYIGDCTGISRRKADDLIRDGRVQVNGKPAEVGQSVLPEKDKVSLDGKPLTPQRKRYVLFHKPPGYITTRSDPEGRKTIYDLLPDAYRSMDPVGRLDRDSSGLLLLSNDGEFIQKMTHPRFSHQRTYKVVVNKPLTEAVLGQLEAGILLQPENQQAVSRVQEVIDLKTVVLNLSTGMNRQIRRSFEALGYDVVKLKRTAFAGLTLGKLAPGKTRELKPREVQQLLQKGRSTSPPGRSKKEFTSS